MLKLTKTGIGLLTKQYRSVLKKCLLLNLGLLTATAFLINVEPKISLAYDHIDLYSGYTRESGRTRDIYVQTTLDTVHNPDLITEHGAKGSYFDLEHWALDVMNGVFLDLSNYYTKSEIQNIQLLNYYYTFRVDERTEVIDSASFFQNDFSTLQEVDLQSKNPTHLGAFAKCDEVCPRPSERFSLSLSQEQMLKNDASVDAGTSRHCLRQFGDVVADLLKNTAAKSLRISEFMNEEVCHA